MATTIQSVRTFNRTVAQRLGVLNEKYLGRDRPYVESRVLYEIGKRGATVRDLRARLDLDSGFLSRLLRTLERKGLAVTQASPADARVRCVRLSRSGMAELRRLDVLSDQLARSMLAPLTPAQSQRLLAAMVEVEQLLRASSVDIEHEDPMTPDALACFAQYFAELDARFRSGFDLQKGVTYDVADFRPPHGRLLVARLHGEAVGCGALRTLEPGVGEIKRMWIAPQARGLGLGRRLLGELERLARQRRLRTIRLDTNRSLGQALHLYRSSGYREIDRFNDNPYADYWFEKRL
jgi:DNA-binding MarR family transcriptional regulator/GNAT superfamily N-acetyltransferase